MSTLGGQPGRIAIPATSASAIAWMTQGRCYRELAQPADFFPTTTAGYARARAYCAACPVRRECLDYALANRIVDGFFGGVSGKERERIRRRAAAARPPVPTVPFGPLDQVLAARGHATALARAEAAQVSARAWQRWKADGTIPAFTARKVAARLDLLPAQLWPAAA